MGIAREFLMRYPELMQLREHSPTWRQLKDRYQLKDLDGDVYLVRGDSLGDQDDLLIDALARGSAEAGSDALARRLFEELPAHLRQAVKEKLL